MPNPLEKSEARIQDAALKVTTTLPAADASADGDSIDLGAAGTAALRSIEAEVAIPALENLANDKDVTVKLQDSEDDTTFADISELAPIVVSGADGEGSDAETVKVRLPSSTRQYIRANYAVEDDGGDNTGDSAVLAILN